MFTRIRAFLTVAPECHLELYTKAQIDQMLADLDETGIDEVNVMEGRSADPEKQPQLDPGEDKSKKKKPDPPKDPTTGEPGTFTQIRVRFVY